MRCAWAGNDNCKEVDKSKQNGTEQASAIWIEGGWDFAFPDLPEGNPDAPTPSNAERRQMLDRVSRYVLCFQCVWMDLVRWLRGRERRSWRARREGSRTLGAYYLIRCLHADQGPDRREMWRLRYRRLAYNWSHH